MSKEVPRIRLKNGAEIPAVGLGTSYVSTHLRIFFSKITIITKIRRLFFKSPGGGGATTNFFNLKKSYRLIFI